MARTDDKLFVDLLLMIIWLTVFSLGGFAVYGLVKFWHWWSGK